MSRDKVITEQPISVISGRSSRSSSPRVRGPGLDLLEDMEELVIQQKIEYLEICTCCETDNKYTIKTVTGKTIFTAEEDSNCCKKNCCGAARSFDIDIKDKQDNVVINIDRPYRPCANCCCCCCPCCLNAVSVYSPPGRLIGQVQEVWHPCVPKYEIQDTDGNAVLYIKGKCCSCTMLPCFKKCRDVTFQVISAKSDKQVGHIKKMWSGAGREIFTDADNFSLSFPDDLHVETKATLLGATFLIDFMFFERGNDDKD